MANTALLKYLLTDITLYLISSDWDRAWGTLHVYVFGSAGVVAS